jgi:peptidoglycan/LPS O-acetylase OafA/YrhL
MPHIAGPGSEKSRIEYLDGLRGLAILLVVFFHAYARWPTLVPYGNQFAGFPVFRFGWLGVNIFFLASGFCALMALERCATAREFLYRRWLRLFPAMIVCSSIIFITAPYFFERPEGKPALVSLLPGLTFVEPAWWEKVTGRPIPRLEESYWYVFAQVRFYVLAAMFYYWKGRRGMIWGLVSVLGIAILARYGTEYIGGSGFVRLSAASSKLSFNLIGWFASGAAFYVWSKDRSRNWFLLAIAIAIISATLARPLGRESALAAVMVAGLFAATLVSPMLQRLLGNPVLQFCAFISYPLYLIHENTMIALIIKMGRHPPALLPPFLPLPAIALLVGVAFLVARYAEPAMRHLISRICSSVSKGRWV